MDRRDFIRILGGGAVLAATASCAQAGVDPRAAWNDPGAGETDLRRRALSWAILAPNPHNMQPWLADLATPNEITLYVDRARLLPVTDPFNRQITIGCGAFLELLRMALAQGGAGCRIEPFPAGEALPLLDDRPVARVVIEGTAAPDPLFAHALARRTSRMPFTDQSIGAIEARALAEAAAVPGVTAGLTTAADRVARLRALVFEGARIEATTPAAHHESVERTFIGRKAVAEHPWGISLDNPLMSAMHAVGILTREKMATPGTQAFEESLKFLKAAADTATGFIWLTTAGDGRGEQIAAGAAYLRGNLAAAGVGLSMHPWSQGLQEYKTQKPLFARLHAELAPQGGRLQMLSRIGYAKSPVPPAPRRGLAANLKDA